MTGGRWETIPHERHSCSSLERHGVAGRQTSSEVGLSRVDRRVNWRM